MDLPGRAAQLLKLATAIPEDDPLQPLFNVPAALKEVYAAAKADIHPIDFTSQALSGFWGRPAALSGWVVTRRTMRPIQASAIRRSLHQGSAARCALSTISPSPGGMR